MNVLTGISKKLYIMHSKLNLHDLRTKINQMTERIVSRLKDRSRYVLNDAVYRRDAIPIEGRTGISARVSFSQASLASDRSTTLSAINIPNLLQPGAGS